jgi:hypothetical protein
MAPAQAACAPAAGCGEAAELGAGRGACCRLAWPGLAWPGLAWPGLAWPGGCDWVGPHCPVGARGRRGRAGARRRQQRGALQHGGPHWCLSALAQPVQHQCRRWHQQLPARGSQAALCYAERWTAPRAARGARRCLWAPQRASACWVALPTPVWHWPDAQCCNQHAWMDASCHQGESAAAGSIGSEGPCASGLAVPAVLGQRGGAPAAQLAL